MIKHRRSSGRLWTRCFLFGVLASAGLVVAVEGDPGPPAWLEVTPNAIQEWEHMTVSVGGIPEGEVVHLEVLRDCDGDGKPERESMKECRSPLYVVGSMPANGENIVVVEFDFRRLEAEGILLPNNETLWLRASRPGSRHARQVVFGIVSNPCNLWASIVDLFFGGRCDPRLGQALVEHR